MARIKIFPLASLQQPLQPWIPELLAVEVEKLRVEYHPVDMRVELHKIDDVSYHYPHPKLNCS
jgi:hypothetical protein